MQKTVLSISYDASLLRTRHWILETAGFHVTSALGFTEATDYTRGSDFDLVIIGHSIPHSDQQALFDMVRQRNHTRVLSLRRPGDLPLGGADESIDAFEGPEVLLSAVRRLLRTTPSPGR